MIEKTSQLIFEITKLELAEKIVQKSNSSGGESDEIRSDTKK